MLSIQLCDTMLLRDRAQREGISFSVVDKLGIRKLDELGIIKDF